MYNYEAIQHLRLTTLVWQIQIVEPCVCFLCLSWHRGRTAYMGRGCVSGLRHGLKTCITNAMDSRRELYPPWSS